MWSDIVLKDSSDLLVENELLMSGVQTRQNVIVAVFPAGIIMVQIRSCWTWDTFDVQLAYFAAGLYVRLQEQLYKWLNHFSITKMRKLLEEQNIYGIVFEMLDSALKSRVITLLTKVHIVKAMIFPVVMYGWEIWAINKAEHWRTDVFDLWCWRRLKIPLDRKEIKSVNPKWNQPWIFTGRNNVEAPILQLPDAKSQLIGKDSDAVKDWRQKEKGMTEDEIFGYHHWLNGHRVWANSGR